MNAPVNPIIVRQAPLTATSWNADDRTIEVIFSTGATVPRFDERGPYIETLSLNQDWSPFIGQPVLNSHRRGDLSDVLGSVQKAWTASGKLEARAVIKLSRRPDVEPIVQDVLDGHIRGVSVGYTVQEWKEDKDSTGRRMKIATRWTPVELSLVSVPADRQATIRQEVALPTPQTTPVITPETTPATTPTVTTPTTTPENSQTTIDRAAVNTEIRSIATVSGLDQAWIDSQIDRGATADMARSAAFEAMRQRSLGSVTVRNATVQIGIDFTDPDVRTRTIGEALFARVTPSHTLSEAARPFFGMTMLDIARDCLRFRNMPTTGLAPSTIVERALHSTSDFPLILGDATGRTLRTAYAGAQSGLKLVGRQTTARDFKDRHRIQLGEAPRLEKVNEHGEFKSGTIAEGKETYRVATYGKVFGLTRQAIINDDLRAFDDVPRKLGQAASATEAQLLVDLILANSGSGPTMSDTNALFHATHGNIATGADKAPLGGATAFDVLVAKARLAMRKQVGLTGELINITPKFIVVPPDQETAGEKGLAQITPVKSEDFNPFSGKLQLVVEPRFVSATRWYVAADPAEVDGLEYAYLEGAEGPQIETKAGFEVDGVQIKVRLDFGAGFVDWRSWYMNPGA